MPIHSRLVSSCVPTLLLRRKATTLLGRQLEGGEGCAAQPREMGGVAAPVVGSLGVAAAVDQDAGAGDGGAEEGEVERCCAVVAWVVRGGGGEGEDVLYNMGLAVASGVVQRRL